ncbi:hypothetical protein [Streptomyces geysiriensis]|uniref:hypothetical protein n=1 Tax=Streptomyces geysiriensis TaxID=68207 RepID=UPI001C7CCE63|nr:hypothetical protein [Streptomyces geysiriensis]MBX4179311.1 hypothetical protein [Streptomyces geysiriensis]
MGPASEGSGPTREDGEGTPWPAGLSPRPRIQSSTVSRSVSSVRVISAISVCRRVSVLPPPPPTSMVTGPVLTPAPTLTPGPPPLSSLVVIFSFSGRCGSPSSVSRSYASAS